MYCEMSKTTQGFDIMLNRYSAETVPKYKTQFRNALACASVATDIQR